MSYYLLINGQTVGPMSAEQLGAYNVDANTQISTDGGQTWRPLYAYPDLMNVYGVRSQQDVTNKRVLCGIMAILFGTLGVQYFIVGKVGAGLITILLSIVTCGAWEIVTLIQGIMMLTMDNQTFLDKYVNTTRTFPLF